MSERSFVWCPICQANGTQTELLRGAPELHIYRCAMGHAFEYEALMARNPTMIKLEAHEKPAPTDIKAQVWVNPELWAKFCAKFPDRKNATMVSIMSLSLDGDLVIISGEQAKKLKALGIKSGADMLATAENNRTLEAENSDLVRENSRFYAAIKGNMAEVGT